MKPFRRVAWSIQQGSLFARNPWRARARELRRLQDLSPIVAGVPRLRQVRHVMRSLIGRRTRHDEQVWAVTMVRNEEDIIGHTVAHLLDQGVDRVVVADNLSTDSTPAVLGRLAADPRVIVVQDRMEAYYQGDKMSRLARAATRAGATWIVPFDADEAWLTADGSSLAAYLRSCDAEVVKGYLEEYVPLPSNDDPNPYVRFQHRAVDSGPHKVAFRANFVSRIWTGNHGVSHPGSIGRGLRIAHVPYRSPDQMRAKVRVGHAALLDAQGLDPGFGSHWRELGMLDDEALNAAFDQLVASKELVHDPVRHNRPEPVD